MVSIDDVVEGREFLTFFRGRLVRTRVLRVKTKAEFPYENGRPVRTVVTRVRHESNEVGWGAFPTLQDFADNVFSEDVADQIPRFTEWAT